MGWNNADEKWLGLMVDGLAPRAPSLAPPGMGYCLPSENPLWQPGASLPSKLELLDHPGGIRFRLLCFLHARVRLSSKGCIECRSCRSDGAMELVPGADALVTALMSAASAHGTCP